MKTNRLFIYNHQASSTLDYFNVIKTLGQGSCAKVKLVEDQYSGVMYAAKVIKVNPKVSPLYYRSKLASEVKCLSRLDHPNIISLSNYEESGSYTSKSKGYLRCKYTLLEYCPNGDLFKLLKNNGPLPQPVTLYFFHHIVDALEHLHKHGIAHGDLKPENLLIDKDFKLKLADFELAHFTATEKYVGTEGYLPPEARTGKPINCEKADYYVSGLILFIMYVGHPPFVKSSEDDVLFNMFKNNKEEYWAYIEKRRPGITFPTEFKSLIEGLLNPDPSTRFTSKEINSNTWYIQQFPIQETQSYLKAILS